MKRFADVLGQLGLDDIPQATGPTITPQDKHKAAEMLARHRAHQAGRQWHALAARFFEGAQ
ncbi:hypothetical protein [Streptomyces erythrochromogenes]|uniref:hypothetical protein n=1 Tax=Streptomyces erythrochromogenes TaxID=285574 RepID=UPI0036F5E4A5